MAEEEKNTGKPKFKQRLKNTWEEFKKFVSRGNVIDMAVGVIIGGAFNAVVTAVTNILLSICTWGVPGGISGLITVLPATNASQTGYRDILVGGTALLPKYSTSEWVHLTQAEDFTSAISDMYTLRGATYYYNGLALIDWGALINAVISFVIIALTLFVILKVFTAMKSARNRALSAAKLRVESYMAERNSKADTTEDKTAEDDDKAECEKTAEGAPKEAPVEEAKSDSTAESSN